MARKAKNADSNVATISAPNVAVAPELGSPIAGPAKAPVASAAPAGSMAAMMAAAAAGGASTSEPTNKKGTQTVHVSPEIKAKILKYVQAIARSKSAEASMAMERGPIEKYLINFITEKCRVEDKFIKSVDVEGLLTFTNGKIGLEAPTKGRPLEAIEADLKVLLGAGYEKYIKPRMSLTIKSAALDGYNKTMETLQFLQKALGTKFGELFESAGALELVATVEDGETTTYLTHEYVSNPAFTKQMEPAMAKGLLRMMNITIKAKSEAIATAGEELAKEQAILLEAAAKIKAKK